jgi:hypothetical protein
MSNYDLLEGFIDYTNKDEWKNYIRNYVIPLWEKSLALKEFYENLKNEFQNVLLNEVNKKDLPLLLGGVIPRGEEIYKKNSLARFYNRFFGLKLSDIQSWVLGGELGGIQPKVIVEETSFIRFVNEIYKWTDIALRNQTLVEFAERSINYIELKEDSNKLKELIKDFYQAVLNISVNYNYGTFFLWSIKQITYRFMKAAYPRIDQIRDFLENEFGLEPFKWKAPFSKDSDLYKEYMIWCWPEYNAASDKGGSCGPEYTQRRSFGGSICVLNEIIWKYLTKGYSPTELEKLFTEYFSVFPYLKEEYVNRVKDRLPGGKIYSYIYYKGLMAAEDRYRVGEANLTIMQMIDELSPYLFTGLAKIAYVGDDYIYIQQL